jgi:WASH complex subunit strumpellin
LPETARLLKEGAMVEEKMIDGINKVMNVVRECNVALRWIMLHTTPLTPSKQISNEKNSCFEI